jgi:hypothetical protein
VRLAAKEKLEAEVAAAQSEKNIALRKFEKVDLERQNIGTKQDAPLIELEEKTLVIAGEVAVTQQKVDALRLEVGDLERSAVEAERQLGVVMESQNSQEELVWQEKVQRTWAELDAVQSKVAMAKQREEEMLARESRWNDRRALLRDIVAEQEATARALVAEIEAVDRAIEQQAVVTRGMLETLKEEEARQAAAQRHSHLRAQEHWREAEAPAMKAAHVTVQNRRATEAVHSARLTEQARLARLDGVLPRAVLLKAIGVTNTL